jgi:hypothetical protein
MATLDEIQVGACDDGIASITSPIKLLQIVAQLLNTDMADTDTILEEACESGIANVMSEITLLQIIAQLLQDGAGGGGAQEVFQNAENPPTTAPTDPTKPALHYVDGGGPISQWDVGSQTWL